MGVFTMGSIRARSETGKLFLDFRFQGKRCREQTLLDDTPANKKRLKAMLDKIEAEITLGSFNYIEYFPSSKLAEFFKHKATVIGNLNNAPLFRVFADTWFNEMKIGWRISHQSSISGILNNRINNYFGDKTISLITKAELMQFRAQLGGVKLKSGKGLSAQHINRHMKIIRMVLNEAADRFGFTTPFVNIKPLKVPKTDVDPFTLEEINQLLSTVRADFKSYYTVRFFTGMRTSEIDGLKWKYVDFERKQILVRETLVQRRIEYTKTDASQREIDMSIPVYQALKRQYKVTKNHAYVFTSSTGSPLHYNNVSNRVWFPLLAHLGFSRRRPYQTRHTAATLWLASGESPEWIARQMGHTTTEMLFRIYSRYVPNLTRQDGSAFEQLLQKHLNKEKTGA